MADLTITAANVGVGEQAVTTSLVKLGEAATHGQPLYRDAATDTWFKADADDQTKAKAGGITLTPGAINEYVLIITGGLLELGAILTVGTQYVVSTVVGGIAPRADILTGDYLTSLGLAETTSKLKVNIDVLDVTVP